MAPHLVGMKSQRGVQHARVVRVREQPAQPALVAAHDLGGYRLSPWKQRYKTAIHIAIKIHGGINIR